MQIGSEWKKKEQSDFGSTFWNKGYLSPTSTKILDTIGLNV